jgi:hypothetical protein
MRSCRSSEWRDTGSEMLIASVASGWPGCPTRWVGTAIAMQTIPLLFSSRSTA